MARLTCALLIAALALSTPTAAPAQGSPPAAAAPAPTKARFTLAQMEALVAEPLRLAKAGDMPAADQSFRRLLEDRRRRYGAASIEASDTLNAFMILLFREGRRKEAMAYRLEALDAARRAWGSDHLEYALILNDLVAMDYELNRDGVAPEAESALAEVHRIRRERLGESHPETIAALIDLGQIQGLRSRTGGDLAKAAPAAATLQRAIAAADAGGEATKADRLMARAQLARVFARNGAVAPALQTLKTTLELAAAQQADGAVYGLMVAEALRDGGFGKEAAALSDHFVKGLVARAAAPEPAP